MDGRTVGTNWYGTVRGTNFWYEILFGTVRGTEFGPEFLLVRYVERNLVRKSDIFESFLCETVF